MAAPRALLFRGAAVEVPPLVTVIGGSLRKFIYGLLHAGNQAIGGPPNTIADKQREFQSWVPRVAYLVKYFGWAFGAQGS